MKVGAALIKIPSGRELMINTRDQWKFLHTWIMSVIVKQNLVHFGRIDGPTEYVSQTLAAILTPESIKFNRFLKLILPEHKPLLAWFGFVTGQKWRVSMKLVLRKPLNLIDSGVKIRCCWTARPCGVFKGKSFDWKLSGDEVCYAAWSLSGIAKHSCS